MKSLTKLSASQVSELLTDESIIEPTDFMTGFNFAIEILEKINNFDPVTDEKLDGYEQSIKNNGLVKAL